jgi:hypothetical protein
MQWMTEAPRALPQVLPRYRRTRNAIRVWGVGAWGVVENDKKKLNRCKITRLQDSWFTIIQFKKR